MLQGRNTTGTDSESCRVIVTHAYQGLLTAATGQDTTPPQTTQPPVSSNKTCFLARTPGGFGEWGPQPPPPPAVSFLLEPHLERFFGTHLGEAAAAGKSGPRFAVTSGSWVPGRVRLK